MDKTDKWLERTAAAAQSVLDELNEITIPCWLRADIRRTAGWFFALKEGVYLNYDNDRFLPKGVRQGKHYSDGMEADQARHMKKHGPGVIPSWD